MSSFFERGNSIELKDSFIEEMRKKLLLYSDIMMKYSIYDTPEATINNYQYKDWVDMWYRIVMDKENIDGRERRLSGQLSTFEEFIEIFKEVSFDNLKRYHENKMVFDITRYLIWQRKRRGDNIIYIEKFNPTISFCIRLEHDTAKMKLDADNYSDPKDKERDNMIYWATYYVRNIIEESQLLDDMKDIVDYVVNKLQYATTNDLNKLVSLSAKKFDIKLKGNAKGLPIYKFNADNGQLICVYVNRKECIDKEGISRAMLSKVISQENYSWHKRVYIEMSEEQAKEEEYNMEKMLTRININKMREDLYNVNNS